MNLSMNKINTIKSTGRLNVVITGGSRGLGAGLVRNFVKHGDKVLSISRQNCDITQPQILYDFVDDQHKKYFNMEPIHVWINNAASSGGYNKLIELQNNDIENIVRTNILGTIIGTKKAIEIMEKQDAYGYIFNLSGAGADYSSTPFFTTYGISKSFVSQFTNSLIRENNFKNTHLCLMSPGMMKTELLLQNIPKKLEKVLDIVAEDPEIVAMHLTKKIKMMYETKKKDTFIRYFDISRIFKRLMS